MLEKTLAKIGFSPSEIKVYLHLLQGCNYANKISAITGLNRTNVYEALDRLVKKGVVSFVPRNNVKWFAARPPRVLQALLKEKQENILALQRALTQDIQELPPFTAKQSLEASIFVGKKGLRALFEEMLEKEKPIYFIAAQWEFKKFFGPYFELWHKQRIAKKIPQKSIFPAKFKERLEKREFLTYKFVADAFTSPTTLVIYGETCLLIQWSVEPFAIKIENKEIVRSHRNYFDMLWQM